MAENPLGTTTRRSFIGAAGAAATAATLTGSLATEAQSADRAASDQTRMAQLSASPAASPAAPPHPGDWTKPAAMAIPKEGYFKLEQGRYGPIFPKTPANYGFSILAKVKPGREQAVRDYGKTIEAAVAKDPNVLAPLKLHYLRWLLFLIGKDITSCTKAYSTLTSTNTWRMLWRSSRQTGVSTVFVNLEDFPENWQGNVPAW